MASCSRTKKCRGREEFNREYYPKVNRCSEKMVGENFQEWQNGRKNKNPAIEPCTFTTDKSKVQRLDTDIANYPLLADKICTINFVQK